MTIYDPVAYYQQIHLCSEKAIKCLLRFANNWLVLVKGGVQYHRYAGQIAKSGYKCVIARVGLALDRLKPTRSIDVCHRGNERALILADLVHLHHEWYVVVDLEPLGHRLTQDRRSEGSK